MAQGREACLLAASVAHVCGEVGQTEAVASRDGRKAELDPSRGL